MPVTSPGPPFLPVSTLMPALSPALTDKALAIFLAFVTSTRLPNYVIMIVLLGSFYHMANCSRSLVWDRVHMETFSAAISPSPGVRPQSPLLFPSQAHLRGVE